MSRLNDHGQPVGDRVDWAPGPGLVPVTLIGRGCRLEPLSPTHLDALHAELCLASPPQLWTYLADGPFPDRAGFAAYVERLLATPATVPLTILLPGGEPAGLACFLRIDRDNGTAEVGSISLSARLQRTTAATEAMYLMARHAFEVARVRRYEWKCDSLNEPSRRAADRLGFTFEGVFRNAAVYKGRNRDTAWYSMTDQEWPDVRAGLERWLEPANFDGEGHQRRPLAARGTRGPTTLAPGRSR